MNNVNQPKIRAEWLLVDEQIKSVLSQLAFCKQHNLIACRFSYYKKQRELANGKIKNASFAPVKMISPSEQLNDIKIELPNGFRCSVPSTVSAENLKAITGALILS